MGRKKKETLPVNSVLLPALRLRSASSSSSAAAKEPEAASSRDFPSSSSAAELLPGPSSDQAQPPPPSLSPEDGAHGSQGPSGLACERRSRRDAMLSIFRSIPTQMDYKGQKLAEQIFQGIILFSAVIGFICGYITEQFGWTVYIVMAGFALSCLLTLPPWPIYRRNPLKWLPVQEVATDDKKPADRKVKRHLKN